ncbi:MAG: cell shape-determining protein [Amycolatopsis sp.]|jgi:succinoglycan biosynthesis transport protein ExoP|uniref:cell shape-determining protein n=1 Tax=Amycolatopsis sp. TaxID=37632 RepID=UPI00260C349C|nr:cell shape-determining protein [Amycolatopsis sp.]MCU1682738.1 cell shape-determining protein [Amycolatopsis sp.]
MDDQPSPKILEALWRYRWSSLVIVGVVFVLSAVAALAFSSHSSATAHIVLKAPDKAGIVGVDAGSEPAFVRYVNQRALYVVSDRVLATASTNLHGAVSVNELRDEVTAKASTNGDSIDLTVAGSVGSTTAIADAVTAAYRTESLADVQAAGQKILDALASRRRDVVASLTPDVATHPSDPNNLAAGQTLSDLDKQATSVRVAAQQFGDGVSFVDKAVADGSGLARSVLRDGGIGIAFGALLAAVLAWVRADRDRRVSGPDYLAAATGSPVLATIEGLAEDEVAGLKKLGSPPLWPYQFAASGLRTAVDRGVVVITSSAPGDGVTTSTLQMATAAALSGARVLMIDAAVRSHGLSDALGLGFDSAGLTAIAVGAVAPESSVRSIDLGHRVMMWAIPAGLYQETTLDHFRSDLLQKAIASMRTTYDLVLVDCASPDIAPEVSPIIRESDGVVVVVRRGRETQAVHRLREQIGLLGGTIAGYLFTFARPKRDAPKRAVPVVWTPNGVA